MDHMLLQKICGKFRKSGQTAQLVFLINFPYLQQLFPTYSQMVTARQSVHPVQPVDNPLDYALELLETWMLCNQQQHILKYTQHFTVSSTVICTTETILFKYICEQDKSEMSCNLSLHVLKVMTVWEVRCDLFRNV